MKLENNKLLTMLNESKEKTDDLTTKLNNLEKDIAKFDIPTLLTFLNKEGIFKKKE